MTQGKEPSDRGENPAETERRPAIDIPPETPNSEDTLGDTQQIDTDAINKRLSTASTPEIPATQNNRPTRPVNRFITTLLKNQTKESQPPRPGSCNYLMFDLSIFVGTERSDILPKLLRELDTILTSKRFHIKVDSKKGYLIILGMAERGATNTLLSIATSMSAWISGTKIILGKGEVEYEDKTTFKIKGLPEGEIEEQVEALGVGIHLSTELNDRINKPGSREGALSRIKTRPSTNQKFVQLTEYEPRVSLDTGGPDIMIGYENEEERLDTILKDNTTRLMVVEAEAGHGKTTLLHHTVGKLPAAILCSCDPASDDNDKTKRESKVTGSSLATIAEQLAATLKRENLVGRVPPDRNTEALVDKLLEFSERTRPEKIQSAQKDPDNLSACCLAAIRFITSEMGEKTPLLIEDLHHADRFSVQYITDIIYSHAEKGGKAVYSKRPEEMYESQAEKQLKLRLQGQYGTEAVQTVSLNGLDFQNQDISYKFAYHCLPAELREGKTLGQWHVLLGEKAGRSPFRMVTFMAGIRDNPNENLEVRENVILLSETAKTRIAEVDSEQDFAVYSQERIEKLPPASKRLLQCMAVLGGMVFVPDQTTEILKKILNLNENQLEEVIEPLKKGGYVTNPNTYTLAISHGSTTEFALRSMSEKERNELTETLYNLFKEGSLIHQDSLLAMLNRIARNRNISDKGQEQFWRQYAIAGTRSLDHARISCELKRGYDISKTILSGLPPVNEILATIDQVPSSVQELIANSLMRLAYTAGFLGKFDETDEALSGLVELHKVRPNLVDITEVHLIRFQNTFMKSDQKKEREEMKRILKEDLEEGKNLHPGQKAILGLKIAYRDRRYDEVETIGQAPAIRALGKHSKTTHEQVRMEMAPDIAEAKFIHECRGPFERLRDEIKNRGIDEDVEAHPIMLSLEQTQKLETILENLKKFESMKQENPTAFNPYTELSITLMKGQVLSYFGKYAEAIPWFTETWRQSEQIEVHKQAATAAKWRGDAEVIQSFAEEGIDKEMLETAIKTYSVEGMIPLAEMSETDYFQLAMRAQRLRAIGLLASITDISAAPQEEKTRLAKHLQTAWGDFKYVNTIFKDLSEDPEILYYTLGYFEPMIIASEQLQEDGMETNMPQDLYDEQQYPYVSLKNTGKALDFSINRTDKGIGELARKFVNIANLSLRLRRRKAQIQG